MKKKIPKDKFRKIEEDQLYSWYNFNIDRAGRTLYFGPWNDSHTALGDFEGRAEWEINDYSAQNIIKGLHVLEQESHEPITMIFFSCGGDWDAGMAIRDFMISCNSPIIMKCFGRVRSMGTIMLQAADTRLLSAECLFLIHYGKAGVDLEHTSDFLAFAEHCKIINKRMEEIYLERIREKKARFSVHKLREMMMFDLYLFPQQAIEIGLADGLV